MKLIEFFEGKNEYSITYNRLKELQVEDLKNVYNLMFAQQDQIISNNIDFTKCDSLVDILGLDKMRSLYYHNSRQKMDQKTVPQLTASWNFDDGPLEIPPEVVAIKFMELKL